MIIAVEQLESDLEDVVNMLMNRQNIDPVGDGTSSGGGGGARGGGGRGRGRKRGRTPLNLIQNVS